MKNVPVSAVKILHLSHFIMITIFRPRHRRKEGKHYDLLSARWLATANDSRVLIFAFSSPFFAASRALLEYLFGCLLFTFASLLENEPREFHELYDEVKREKFYFSGAEAREEEAGEHSHQNEILHLHLRAKSGTSP
jgi:hypothetical protein